MRLFVGYLFTAFFMMLQAGAAAQPCNIVLSGQVNDKHEGSPLPFSNVFVNETGKGAVVDSAGFFSIQNICKGGYHIQFSHIGCEPFTIYIVLNSDTTVFIELEHHAAFLQTVEIAGSSHRSSTQTQNTISEDELHKESGKTLSEIVMNVPGVSTIKSGSGISKPVIHGMYGNRISIINNGVVQAGQQWGNDHSPEIDPFSAKQILVVKGVDAIEYGGNGLGGMILVDPGTIGADPHIHGSLHYLFNTNGRGNSAATQFERGGKSLNWRFTGTFKQIGDRESPDYYLTNTGNKESNFSLQLSKRIRKKWFNNLYYSYFQTELGILRGAQVGNLTDLEQAIGRDEPFYTKQKFSYDISEPRQDVNHQLLKASSKYYVDDNRTMELIYAVQQDIRKEFDVRRGGRSETPALDLFLQNHFVELNMADAPKTNLDYKMGLQYRHSDNINDPATGILPLIPNYLYDNAAAYGRVKYRKGRKTYELGGRYDLMLYEVNNISVSLPRVVEQNSHEFHNYSVSAGIKMEHRLNLLSTLNVGYTERSPEMNELYSSGLHQGVAGIEEGNRNLNPEQAVKAIWTTNYSLSDKLNARGSIYHQFINDYIFLEPQEEYRLTIRGAFPVFLYKQTNATISGLDLSLLYKPFKHIAWDIGYAIVRGNDRENKMHLIYMPPDQLSSSLGYRGPLKGSVETFGCSLIGQYVFQQTRLDESQDFLAPPGAYFLLGAKSEIRWKRKKTTIQLFVQADNLLNAVYRDYLNRLRYYADAEGRNVRVGLKYGF